MIIADPLAFWGPTPRNTTTPPPKKGSTPELKRVTPPVPTKGPPEKSGGGTQTAKSNSAGF